MIHFLLVDDCYPINTRNQKIIESIKSYYGQRAWLTVVTWDRNNDCSGKDCNYYLYKKKSDYGHKIKKLINLWGFCRYCRDNIKTLAPDVIIASHWNNLLVVPKLGKNQMLIYENLDVPTESYLVRKFSTMLEHWEMRRVDLTIHASRFFVKLYPSDCRQLILENKPTFRVALKQEYIIHTPIRISFIGLIRYREVLSLLVDAVRGDTRFELYFHGDGHARSYLEEYAKLAPNIFFTGKYSYDDILNLYEQTDVIWAAYPNKDFNVKYAISNKFHESLFVGKPAIFADETFLGDYVERLHLGLKVDPYSIDAIKALLNHISTHTDELKAMVADMRKYYRLQSSWDEDFKNVAKVIDQFIYMHNGG